MTVEQFDRLSWDDYQRLNEHMQRVNRETQQQIETMRHGR